MNERKWIDFEPEESSFSAYEISKKVINLLRHSQTVQRDEDGAVQFWRIIISKSVPKILISNVLLDTSLHHSFQSVIIRS